jgi:hypothetical protein
MALVPTTPNPTTYGCSCTKPVPFRYRFDEKPALIVPLPVSRFLPVRILKPAAAGRQNPAKISPGIPPPGTTPISATVGQGQERWLPGADQRNLGPFPPQETAFYGESTETFEPRNDLAAKRPDPVM